MPETFLSTFTPSLSKPETLEAITVGRRLELSRIVELVANSVNTRAKHHVLLVGPRGIGKTHLISLINHRLQSATELRDRMITVWLKEEEWGVSSFLDLLLRILRNLAETRQTDLKPETVESLFDIEPKEAESSAARLLKKVSGDNTLVLLAENLDEIFKGLGESGQQKLRSFIQENPFISIVATTQSLFAGVSSQTEPFYGFFSVYHLAAFSFAEAVEMLVKIAELRRDRALADYLKTPEGRARVRAVHHLVGGSPRLYVIFSEFLNRSAIEDLVTPFMKMLDELTPYYQERMRSLSHQQRQIVEILCDAGKPLTVKEIARRAFITHQTASGQLKQLREYAYVDSRQFGRESLYELREPLMRLTVEVKKNRGEPVRLLVDFLRLWYSPEEIESRLEMLGGEPCLESDYLTQARHVLLSDTDDPRVAVCKADYNRFIDKGDLKSALAVADELIAIKSNFSNWYLKWSLADSLGLRKEYEEADSKLNEIAPKDAYDWYIHGDHFLRRRKLSQAIDSFKKSIELNPDLAEAWSGLTSAWIRLRDYGAARESSARAIELAPENIDNWYQRAHIVSNSGSFEEAKPVYQKVIDLDPNSFKSWMNMGWLHCQFNKFAEALPFMVKAVELNPNNAGVLTNYGWALAGLKRYEEALANFDRALALDPSNAMAFNNRGWALIELDRFDEALQHFEFCARVEPMNSAAWDGLAQVFFHLERYEDALAAAEKAIKFEPQHFKGWSIQGSTLSILGKHSGALLSLDEALKNGDHSSTTLFYRALALVATGKEKEGFAELDHAFYHACRVHGINLKSVMHLFELIFNQFEKKWSDFIGQIIASYAKNNLTHRLGPALVKFAFRVLQMETEKEKVGRWITTWRESIEKHPELQFSRELLETAWAYAQTGDESVLYNLPSEERKLITDFGKFK
jgi:tetratricopeptide (TPR) repeat protein